MLVAAVDGACGLYRVTAAGREALALIAAYGFYAAMVTGLLSGERPRRTSC